MINSFLKRLAWLVRFLCGAAFLSVFSVNLLRIVLRNILGTTWFWIDGFSRLTFIWMIFLGATALYAADDHLVMDFLLDRMHPAAKRILKLLTDFVFFGFSLVLVYYGSLVFVARLGIPYTYWNVPTGYAYLAVPVNGALMALYSLRKLVLRLKGSTEISVFSGSQPAESPRGMP
jgi:TRAP-type C4-dicarboxylate transport system permease small subunit